MDDCCRISPGDTLSDRSICTACGQKGKPVSALTIRSLTRRHWPHYAEITDGYFCTNPNDSTVYYFPTLDLTVDKEHVVDRVGIKETEEPIYVCYCFRHTKQGIESDFMEHSRSMIEENVREKVSGKLCSCEVTNPSGQCCLGDIRKTYKRLEEELVSAEKIGEG